MNDVATLGAKALANCLTTPFSVILSETRQNPLGIIKRTRLLAHLCQQNVGKVKVNGSECLVVEMQIAMSWLQKREIGAIATLGHFGGHCRGLLD